MSNISRLGWIAGATVRTILRFRKGMGHEVTMVPFQRATSH